MIGFEQRINAALLELGITEQLRQCIATPLQIETVDLVRAEDDMFGREALMTPATAIGWHDMKAAAMEDGITLQLVSAFRSVDYQCGLIRRKIESGQCIEDILKVNAAPGFSEHHTGCALDLSTPECEPLSDAFENTEAFAWLNIHAATFGFVLSYPRDNPFGISYEPWHWACKPAYPS